MTRRLLVLTGAGALLLLLTLLAWYAWRTAESAKTAARLATSQAAAAIASGADASDTIGNRMDADAATDQRTRTNDEAIHQAAGADVAVGAVGDAGLAGLCQRNAYRGDPRCLHEPAAR